MPLIEHHPFTPFLPDGCKVILCGTFPPKPAKWSMDFFYPNFQNDMWRIFGIIFYNDKDKFFNLKAKTIDKQAIQQMLTQCHVGIGETVTEAIRTKDNASDKFLQIVKTVDLPDMLAKAPDCEAIVTTGEKAASVIAGLTCTPVPAIGKYQECLVKMADGSPRQFRHWRMPSTSRAFPMKTEQKASFYRLMFQSEGLLTKSNQ